MKAQKLRDLIEMAKNISPKKKVAVAVAEDDVVLKSIEEAVKIGVCDAILFGNEEKIKAIAGKENVDLSIFEIRNFEDKMSAIKAAVKSISDGECDLPMKGNSTT